jgi:hypothetical protein
VAQVVFGQAVLYSVTPSSEQFLAGKMLLGRVESDDTESDCGNIPF